MHLLMWCLVLLQMNGVANGDAVNLALQGLTVQGSSNNNNDNKAVESTSDRLPRGKVIFPQTFDAFFWECIQGTPLWPEVRDYSVWILPAEKTSLGSRFFLLEKSFCKRLDGKWIHLVLFFSEGQFLWLPVCFPVHQASSEKGFILKGKHLILMFVITSSFLDPVFHECGNTMKKFFLLIKEKKFECNFDLEHRVSCLYINI